MADLFTSLPAPAPCDFACASTCTEPGRREAQLRPSFSGRRLSHFWARLSYFWRSLFSAHATPARYRLPQGLLSMGAGQTILPPSLPAGMGHPKPLPLSPGTVLVLHRLINYEDFREGEMFALYELMRARPDLAVEVLGTSTKMIITNVAMLRGHPNRCLAKRNGGVGYGAVACPAGRGARVGVVWRARRRWERGLAVGQALDSQCPCDHGIAATIAALAHKTRF